MPDEPFGVTYASHYGRDNQVRRDPAIAKQIGSYATYPFYSGFVALLACGGGGHGIMRPTIAPHDA
jgi:hypothetical protein